MNSYFRLVATQMGTGVELIPPTDGGERIDVNELVAYLQAKRIVQYDIKELYQAVQVLKDEPTVVMLPVAHRYPEDEMFFFEDFGG